jgi:ABC-type transport system involved in multi-copper enzyme maturation permease subunit
MSLDFKVVSAIFRKDMRTYLGNPTGYVFLTLFIAATAAAAFLTEEFFARNLADLATLNRWMPAVLMFFVPAITMNAWADERRGGTDEILLTLPVRDGEVVLGKYLGILGMYTLSLGLSTAHIVVLAMLGEPDPGLMFATYAGYWLMGALFGAVGLLGSMFTLNSTVAFILGGLGCAGLVFTGTLPWASAFLGIAVVGLLSALTYVVVTGTARFAAYAGIAGAAVGGVLWQAMGGGEEQDATNAFQDVFATLSVQEHFRSFGEGVMRLSDVAFFVGGVAVLLYLCAFLLGRRHW